MYLDFDMLKVWADNKYAMITFYILNKTYNRIIQFWSKNRNVKKYFNLNKFNVNIMNDTVK